VVTKTSQPLTLTAFDLPDHMAARQDKRLFDGVTYGILLTLLVYNLALAASFRDRTYVHYVLASAAALMTLVSFNGHGARYLFPNWPAAIEASYVVFPSLWILFGALFAHSFLNLASRAPWFARLNLLTMALSGVALFFGLRGDITTAQRLNEVLSLAGMGIVFTAGLLVLTRGYRPAAWYISGQMLLFSAVLTVVLANWGQLDWPFVLASGLQIGVAAELVVFAIALGSRVRLLKHESSRLETHAATLAQEARTDPLTGLLNRSGLALRAQELLDRPSSHALMLMDLDRFKPVNDVHGHAAGDAVLVQVAQRLTQAVREGDAVARRPDRAARQPAGPRHRGRCPGADLARPCERREDRLRQPARAAVPAGPDAGDHRRALQRGFRHGQDFCGRLPAVQPRRQFQPAPDPSAAALGRGGPSRVHWPGLAPGRQHGRPRQQRPHQPRQRSGAQHQAAPRHPELQPELARRHAQRLRPAQPQPQPARGWAQR